MQTLLSPQCLWHTDLWLLICVCSFTLHWGLKSRQPLLTYTALTPPTGRAQRQLAFPWRFNSSISYSVFLAFLCSNYSFKIITNFFLFSKFHLASYTEIFCREFKLLDRNLSCHIPPQMVQSALQFMPDS